MKEINRLFDRMDQWRHLPNYQLERRADLFFSLYLPEVLEAKLGYPVAAQVVPEFPVRIGTIDPDIPYERSYKIDYVVISKCGKKAILVELKTDNSSRRTAQDDYLLRSRDAGFSALLGGVLEIFKATNSKRKYFVLLEYLESMGLLDIPSEMKEIMSRPRLQGATEASRGISMTASSITDCVIVYVQPSGKGDDIISFEDFCRVLEKYDDPISSRFSSSLSEWARVTAGDNRS